MTRLATRLETTKTDEPPFGADASAALPMATLREYFDTDFSTRLNSAQQVHWHADNLEGDVPVRVHLDFDSNAKFLSCYLPTPACRRTVVNALLDNVDDWLAIGNGVEVHTSLPGESSLISTDLRFAGRLFIYHETDLPDDVQEELRRRARDRQVLIQFRGPQFASGRSSLERPLAFVSHDSRDKDEVARPIAIGLAALMCPVWFDEFSLRVGDRLRESIERGLREARKCILVVSPNFIANRGWTREEFSAIFTRELVERADLILRE